MARYLASLRRASDGKKKFVVFIFDTKTAGEKPRTIKFGQYGAKDYTEHRDEDKRLNYWARHRVNENLSDPLTAGFWSAWLSWGEYPDYKRNLAALKRKFDIEEKSKDAIEKAHTKGLKK